MAQHRTDAILQDVEKYYRERLRRHGATALGVDWSSPMSQRLRFVQLLKVVDWKRTPLSLHDLGCGYGALLEHLQDRHQDAKVHYLGTDLSEAMIERARRRWVGKRVHASFERTPASLPMADYTIASGIFNVCLGHPELLWEDHVRSTLRQMRDVSRLGFSVNFMSSTMKRLRPDAVGQLYTTEPSAWATYCTEQLGCQVQLVQDYGLSEFTLLCQAR